MKRILPSLQMSRLITYHVAGWNAIYENNRSRTVKDLNWVPIPNKHDGEKYSRLMLRPDAAELFAAWILVLQVASRCQPRGSLLRGDGTPHDPESLSIKTRAPLAWFTHALPTLSKIGWLTSDVTEQLELAPCRQEPVSVLSASCQAGDEEGRKEGREGNRKEGNGKKLEAAQAPRAQDELLHAICRFAELTDPAAASPRLWPKCATALKEIRQATPDVTPAEIARRAGNYPTHFRDATISATALAGHWGRCADANPRNGALPWQNDSHAIDHSKPF